MHPYLSGLRVILCGLLLTTFQSAAANGILSGRPAQIVSGNELILMANNGTVQRIKLIGIDTEPPNLPWGATARRHLQSLVMGRSVTIFFGSKDQTGRVFGVLRHGGANINMRLISAGLARFNPTGLSPTDAEAYAAAEQEARRAGLGIWGSEKGGLRSQSRRVPGGPLFRLEQ